VVRRGVGRRGVPGRVAHRLAPDAGRRLRLSTSLCFPPVHGFRALTVRRARHGIVRRWEEFGLICAADCPKASLSSRGGGGGIRTHGRREPPTIFKTVPFDRSGTPPRCPLRLFETPASRAGTGRRTRVAAAAPRCCRRRPGSSPARRSSPAP